MDGHTHDTALNGCCECGGDHCCCRCPEDKNREERDDAPDEEEID